MHKKLEAMEMRILTQSIISLGLIASMKTDISLKQVVRNYWLKIPPKDIQNLKMMTAKI